MAQTTAPTDSRPLETTPFAEYAEHPVPLTARRRTRTVGAVWLGFPMILTCAIFGGLVVSSLGFWVGMAAIAVGTLVLMVYVGALSYFAGRTGENFALMARRTFGSKGYVVPAGFLATVVIGWFALQTGLTGSTLHASLGWNEAWTTLVAGVLYVALTLFGIRALSWIGIAGAPLYLLLGVTAIVLTVVTHGGAGVTSFAGSGAGALSFGAAVTLIVALFADSGTMTADFTRWSKTGPRAVLASLSAFPVGNAVALVIGGLIVALGGAAHPDSSGGDFLGILISHGGVLVPLAIVFVFVNLGSVCTHCLYNGAVGWSHLTGGKMRLVTLALGAVGVTLAVAGIANYFTDWLNLLGIVVPPIGAVLIVDQAVHRRRRTSSTDAGPAGDPSTRSPWRVSAFAAWILGSAAALLANVAADFLSTAVVGIVVAGAVTYLHYRITRDAVEAPILLQETGDAS